MTYEKLYETGMEQLKEYGIEEAALDARLLLEYQMNTDINTLLVHGDLEVSDFDTESYVNLIDKRKQHIPLQYITGFQEFMGLKFCVNESTLIPRQDTETLVEEVMRFLHDGMSVLDVCTGSGCILISILHYSNDCFGVGTDISSEAIKLAKRNAANQEISALWLTGNLFETVQGKFDIIVSNPPYIEKKEIEFLSREVKDNEPLSALDGGEDGLFFYREIVREASRYLSREGMLFFEIGYNQGKQVRLLMEQTGYLDVTIVKDLSGKDRVVYGTYNKR